MPNLDPILEKSINQISDRLTEIQHQFLSNAGITISRLMSMSNEELRTLLYSGGVLDITNHDLAKIRKVLNQAHRANVTDMKQLARDITATVYQEGTDIAEAKGETISPKKAYVAAINPLLAQTLRNYEIMAKSVAVNDTYKKTISQFVNRIISDDDRLSAPQAMRQTIRTLLDHGIEFIDYKNGRSVRMDSAVRNALFTEYTSIAQSVMRKVGEEVSADAYEISSHAHSAPDHEPIQGRVFEVAEFEKLQSGENAKDIEGETFQTDRPIGMFNCRHLYFPFIIGVSEPSRSTSELNQLEAQNESGITFNGKHMSLYEGEQLQRRMELAVRHERDNNIMLREVKDIFPEMQADYSRSRARIKGLKSEYERLAETLRPHAIRAKRERMTVPRV